MDLYQKILHFLNNQFPVNPTPYSTHLSNSVLNSFPSLADFNTIDKTLALALANPSNSLDNLTTPLKGAYLMRCDSTPSFSPLTTSPVDFHDSIIQASNHLSAFRKVHDNNPATLSFLGSHPTVALAFLSNSPRFHAVIIKSNHSQFTALALNNSSRIVRLSAETNLITFLSILCLQIHAKSAVTIF